MGFNKETRAINLPQDMNYMERRWCPTLHTFFEGLCCEVTYSECTDW